MPDSNSDPLFISSLNECLKPGKEGEQAISIKPRDELFISGTITIVGLQDLIEEPGLNTADAIKPKITNSCVINFDDFQSQKSSIHVKNKLSLLSESNSSGTVSQIAKFIDSHFKPGAESIVGFNENLDFGNEKIDHLGFERAEAFFSQNQDLLRNINPNDIVPGQLNNRYFHAALCSLAQLASIFDSVFLVKTHQQHGFYCFSICIDGIFEEVPIDDFLVVNKRSKSLAFSSAQDNSLWVALLEKAWAKTHGGYANISNGTTREVFRELTGAPTQIHLGDGSREHLWSALMTACKKRQFVTAGTDELAQASNLRAEKVGLCGANIYCLLDVREVVLDEGGFRTLAQGDQIDGRRVERLLKLKNPLGTGEWNGEWGAASPLWTPQLKKELDYSAAQDGIFCMTFNEFVRYFVDVQICLYEPAYKYSALRL